MSCLSDVGPARHPREAVELGLVARGQLCVHGRERGLLPRELLVEVARVRASVLGDNAHSVVSLEATGK